MTLAYTFWHWPRPGVDAADYEARQRAFHAALGRHPPDGFLRSYSYSLSGAPWAAGGAAYEDWYLVDGFGALGTLNDAAVTASRRAPHDAAAAPAAGGAGGVYRLRFGDPPPDARVACWLSKPEGVSYDALWPLLAPLEESGAAVWMRQMVLGPAPEFCVQAPAEIAIPEPLRALRLPLRRVFP
jgi:hypothetical protein